MHGVGANSSKFYVMTDEEKAKLRDELGYEMDTKIILNVGELNENKNQKSAIRAMKRIVEKVPNSKLLIAGNGPELDNHKVLISELGLEKNVELLGYTTEVFKYMNICDALVACSFREGLPLNLMEAMLCGKPIVASINRGHKELIKDGYNGFLVGSTDIDAYAEKLLEVIESPKSFSQNAVEYVKPYTDVCVLEELKELYKVG